MGRVNLGMSDKHKEIYNECLADYGKMMTIANIMDFLGYKRDAAEEWAAGLQKYQLNGRTIKYRTIDVSKKLADARV